MEKHNSPDACPSRTMVVGEEYLDMVGDWQISNIQENDVHEDFKALTEIAIDKAYIVEKADGSLMAFNATVSVAQDGSLDIIPAEDLVTSVHVNLLASPSRNVRVSFAAGDVTDHAARGMTWIAAADAANY